MRSVNYRAKIDRTGSPGLVQDGSLFSVFNTKPQVSLSSVNSCQSYSRSMAIWERFLCVPQSGTAIVSQATKYPSGSTLRASILTPSDRFKTCHGVCCPLASDSAYSLDHRNAERIVRFQVRQQLQIFHQQIPSMWCQFYDVHFWLGTARAISLVIDSTPSLIVCFH